MARGKNELTITASGRDKDKVFIIHEMSADQGERWAIRAIQLIARNGSLEVPDDAHGFAAFASVGIKALSQAPYEALQPLLDEMMTCVRYKHTTTAPEQPIYSGDMCQIEEIATFIEIRRAWFELHMGFSLAG
jgi:hypothetical protein